MPHGLNLTKAREQLTDKFFFLSALEKKKKIKFKAGQKIISQD